MVGVRKGTLLFLFLFLLQTTYKLIPKMLSFFPNCFLKLLPKFLINYPPKNFLTYPRMNLFFTSPDVIGFPLESI